MAKLRADKNTSGATLNSRRFLFVLYVSFLSVLCFGTCQVFAESSLGIGERFKDCAICPEMIVIPAGELIVRSDNHGTEESGQILNVPKMFAMSVYETTIADWENCEFLGGCRPANSIKKNNDEDFGWREWKGTRPVVNVSWEDSLTYVIWLSSVAEKSYWLPTELEWEYAARSEMVGKNPWSELNKDSCAFANLAIHDDCSDSYRGVAPVGSYRANRFGLYDMIGNVSEWTASCLGNMLGSTVDLQRPFGGGSFKASGFGKEVPSCGVMMYRGGSWSSQIGSFDFSTRRALDRGAISEMLGFRVVRSIK